MQDFARFHQTKTPKGVLSLKLFSQFFFFSQKPNRVKFKLYFRTVIYFHVSSIVHPSKCVIWQTDSLAFDWLLLSAHQVRLSGMHFSIFDGFLCLRKYCTRTKCTVLLKALHTYTWLHVLCGSVLRSHQARNLKKYPSLKKQVSHVCVVWSSFCFFGFEITFKAKLVRSTLLCVCVCVCVCVCRACKTKDIKPHNRTTSKPKLLGKCFTLWLNYSIICLRISA